MIGLSSLMNFFKKKWVFPVRSAAIALLLNGTFFFAFPIINYFHNKDRGRLQKQETTVTVTEINLKPKKKPIKRIDTKEERPRRTSEPKTKNSRFQIKFDSEGTGIGGNDKITSIVYREGEVDREPRVKKKVSPRLSGNYGIKGLIKIMIHIDQRGKVSYAEVVEGIDNYEVNEACRNASFRWEFEPALINNIPVKFEYIIPFRIE